MLSHLERWKIACTQCDRPSDAEVWLFVDTAEVPDVVARIRAGTIRQHACPYCAATVPIDAILVVVRHELRPPVLVVDGPPVRDRSPEAMRRIVAMVAAPTNLRPSVGPGKLELPLDVMPVAVDRDLANDIPALYDRSFDASTPELLRYANWLWGVERDAIMQYLRKAVPALLDAEDMARCRAVVEEYPELLTEFADELLSRMIDSGGIESPQQIAVVEHRQLLLRQVNRDGIDAVFGGKA